LLKASSHLKLAQSEFEMAKQNIKPRPKSKTITESTMGPRPNLQFKNSKNRNTLADHQIPTHAFDYGIQHEEMKQEDCLEGMEDEDNFKLDLQPLRLPNHY